jgi:predicted transcriptional regulator
MKLKPAIGDSISLPEDGYLVVRRKGQSMPYTQLLHCSAEEAAIVLKLPGKAQALFNELARRLQFDRTARLTLEERMKLLSLSRSKAQEAMTKLTEVGLVKKVAKDVYKINPRYVWRGTAKERKKAEEEWTQSANS